MRIGIVKSDVPSCELYRARGPAETLASRGEIELVDVPREISVRMTVRRHGPPQPIGVSNLPEGLDVLIMCRGTLPARITQLIPVIQRQGIAVVVDIDDDYEHLPPGLVSLYKINPSVNPGYNWRNAKEGCKLADLVTVSTPPLERYGKDSIVLRNCVPDRYVRIGREVEPGRDGRTVGWGGTVFGHPGDLRIPRAGVSEAIREAGGRFLNVGDGVDIQKDLGLGDAPEITGIVPLEEYPRHLARLDVAIAPLTENLYARCKSYLKYLESLALGSAVVASDTAEYVRLQRELDAWCAENDAPVLGAVAPSKRRDWRREVARALQRSDDERHEASEAARAFVSERHVLSQTADRWGEAWEEAMKRRRTSSTIRVAT